MSLILSKEKKMCLSIQTDSFQLLVWVITWALEFAQGHLASK